MIKKLKLILEHMFTRKHDYCGYDIEDCPFCFDIRNWFK